MDFWSAYKVVAAVRYGPAFPFRRPRATLIPLGKPCAGEGATLIVSVEANDRATGELVEASTSLVLGLHLLDEKGLLEMLRDAWRRLAMHEIDEGIYVDGELRFAGVMANPEPLSVQKRVERAEMAANEAARTIEAREAKLGG